MLFAYIDPAMGAMVIQIIAAAFLAAGVFFRRAVLSPFAFLFRKNSADDANAASGDNSDNA